jgi:hypothetical protein
MRLVEGRGKRRDGSKERTAFGNLPKPYVRASKEKKVICESRSYDVRYK